MVDLREEGSEVIPMSKYHLSQNFFFIPSFSLGLHLLSCHEPWMRLLKRSAKKKREKVGSNKEEMLACQGGTTADVKEERRTEKFSSSFHSREASSSVRKPMRLERVDGDVYVAISIDIFLFFSIS